MKSKSISKVLILCHDGPIPGAVDLFGEFLASKGHEIVRLNHPLDERLKTSRLILNGKAEKEIHRSRTGTIALVADAWISLKLLFGRQADIGIGANNFDTVSLIVLKRIFRYRIRKIIYFASDFSENKYQNSFLNTVYYQIEKIALKYADLTISNTERANTRRVELGLSSKKGIVVPNPVLIDNPVFLTKQIDRSSFIYVGSLDEEHGLYQFIVSCWGVIKNLTIIGDGHQLKSVAELCKKHGIQLTHYPQMGHAGVIASLQKFSGFGLAPYDASRKKYTYYGSSLKISEYISCGLPVITSNVTEQSAEIAPNGLGIVYEQLGYESIKLHLESFQLAGFNKKAENFYHRYSAQTQYGRLESRMTESYAHGR